MWAGVGMLAVLLALLGAWLLHRGAAGRQTTTTPGGNRVAIANRVGSNGEAAAAPRHLAGRVLLDGKPIAASVIAYREAAGPIVVTASANGRFELAVPAATYVLRARAPGVVGKGLQVDLRDADRNDIVLAMTVCTRDLAGTVTDSSGGAPIEGARIFGGFVTTDKAGHFALCDMNEQTEIAVEADGFASVVRHLMPGENDVDFALAPEAVVSGTVVGADRSPIANASVHLLPSMRSNRDIMRLRNMGGSATSDSSGRFTVHGLGIGAYDVHASATGFVLAAPITATVTLNTHDLLVTMRPADTIRGVARSSGHPVANARITWIADDGGGAESTTHGDGSFEIADTRFGRGMFAVNHFQPARNIVVDKQPVMLELTPAMEIRGRVLHDGTPVNDAEVSGAGIPTISDDGGHFVVQVLGPGSFQLIAVSEALGGFSSPKPITIAEGQSIDGIDLEIAFSASVSGTVVDQAGAPIARAKVELENAELGDVGAATSRDDGTFRATQMSGGKGTYKVKVTMAGHELPPIGAAVTVAVPGAQSAVADIRIAVTLERTKLAGQVVDDRGAPVPDASIEARGLTTRSDAEGHFSLDVVDRGTYTLHVAGPSGMRAIVDVVAATGLKIVLHDPGRVHVTCDDHADVQLYTSAGTTFSNVACGSTATDVPAGPITGVAPSGAMGQTVVQPGGLAELALAHQPVRGVNVRVLHDSSPVTGAACWTDYGFSSWLAGNPSTTTTDATGTTVISMARLRGRVWCDSPRGGSNAVVEASADSAVLDLR